MNKPTEARQDELAIRKKMVEVLTEDLIVCGCTHENPPPHKDCGKECGLGMDDQIAAANPFCSPVRSGGKKHKKCMDCWNEYISDLITKLFSLTVSSGGTCQECYGMGILEVRCDAPKCPACNGTGQKPIVTKTLGEIVKVWEDEG